jgi:hypothetical protein
LVELKAQLDRSEPIDLMSELAGFETLSDLKARHAKELGDVKFQGRQRVKVYSRHTF